MSRLLVATHADCALHVPALGHPERPARLEAAIAGAALPGAEALPVVVDEALALAAIARVHAPGYAGRLKAACQAVPGVFDSDDNPVSAGTYRAAIAAVCAVLAAVGTVIEGTDAPVFAPVRPPGHHALRDRAMGFCFFNNVAVLAEELLAGGVGPLAIVDFDVHHGNGTQAHFWRRSDVTYLSVHRHLAYPGTGGADEIGEGSGRGFTRNFPLGPGADDATYVEALAAGLEEVTAITPAAWLVSAGFDAHRDDPLGGMSMTEEGFGAIGHLIRESAGGRPIVAVLEGGYRVPALQSSVRSFLNSLTSPAKS